MLIEQRLASKKEVIINLVVEESQLKEKLDGNVNVNITIKYTSDHQQYIVISDLQYEANTSKAAIGVIVILVCLKFLLFSNMYFFSKNY